jgi:hypothetical protein
MAKQRLNLVPNNAFEDGRSQASLRYQTRHAMKRRTPDDGRIGLPFWAERRRSMRLVEASGWLSITVAESPQTGRWCRLLRGAKRTMWVVRDQVQPATSAPMPAMAAETDVMSGAPRRADTSAATLPGLDCTLA